MAQSYLTAEGAAKLKQELDHLINTARVELAQRLRSAIQMGDLSENADYSAAKEEQAFLEGRIQELELTLRDAVIIDDLKTDKSIVNIGDSVTIQEEDYPEEVYFLVGPKEADPANGRISHESPIGMALLGHRVGDKVLVKTPNGQLSFIIRKIE